MDKNLLKIGEHEVYDDRGVKTLSLNYDCQSDRLGLANVNVTFNFEDEACDPIKIVYQKRCGPTDARVFAPFVL